MHRTRVRWRQISAVLLAVFYTPTLQAEEAGFVEQQLEAFRDSEFVIERGGSNLPFFPLAFLGASEYGEAEVEAEERGVDLTYDLTSVSQGAMFPVLTGERDMFIFGEYLSYSEFNVKESSQESFEVRSLGIPVGWARQVSPEWQVMTFAMPLGHDNSLSSGGWSWQTLGGVFSRWVQRPDLWGAFGLYVDIGPEEDLALPYLGAAWRLNEAWTVSAILPWPSINYGPDDKWLIRFGASPSAASWSVSPEDGTATVNLDAFDFGIGIERRVTRLFWLSGEAGIGGLRGVRFSDNDIETPDVDAGSGWYASIDIKLRPRILQ